MRAREEGKEKIILLNWSGHGLMDLTGYEKFLSGNMVDATLSKDELDKSLQSLAGLPQSPKL